MTQTTTVQPQQKKLSQAMREGAQLHPQGYGSYVTTRYDGILCTCAMGAAYEAYGIPINGTEVEWKSVSQILGQNGVPFKEIYEKPVSVPKILITMRCYTVQGMDNIANIIFLLNDKVYWTREQIADWLESIGY